MRSIRDKNEETNPGVPDQHSSSVGAAQVTKPATIIRNLIADATASAVDKTLARIAAPNPSARCMNPKCKKQCKWGPRDRGRAPKFCDDSCRIKFARERSRLTDLLGAYLELRAIPDIDRAKLIQIDRRISIVRMQLLRYPST